jgi:hypothetical protein
MCLSWLIKLLLTQITLLQKERSARNRNAETYIKKYFEIFSEKYVDKIPDKEFKGFFE